MEFNLLVNGGAEMGAVKVDLKQYITNGFVRSGVSYFGYGIILGVITAGLGYGTYIIHQKNSLNPVQGFSQIVGYLLLVMVGILVLVTFSLLYHGIKLFKQFVAFMKSDEVVLISHEEPMSIGIALDYLSEETIIYENRQLVLTEKHIIILDGEPCIKPKSLLRAASLDTRGLKEGQRARLNQLKTVVLEFKNHELKKVNCHYIQEANDILQKLREQGIRMI
ncbi:hypothetical protein [Turicibacter sanguinis]|uniref:hypothetical protein n=1 Tax=Turicibacter sanguinis TaxID=154288 RepID=UPI00189C2A91|nr:hypothetical protein [Turicibacter sanguinis]